MRTKRAKPNSVTVNGVYDGKPEDANNPNALRTYIVEAEEAERVVNVAKGRTYYISVRQNPICRDQSGAGEGNVMTFKVFGNVIVTKEEALRFLANSYDAKTRAESWVRLTISDNCMFIG